MNNSIGSTLDDLLAQDGTLSEVTIIALNRVLAWQSENLKVDSPHHPL